MSKKFTKSHEKMLKIGLVCHIESFHDKIIHKKVCGNFCEKRHVEKNDQKS